MAVSANTKLVHGLVSHTVDMMRLETGVRNRVNNNLLGLAQDLDVAIQDADLQGRSETSRRLNALLKSVDSTIGTTYRNMNTQLTDELITLGDYSQESVVQLFNNVFRAEVVSVALNKTDLTKLASNVMVQGAPTADWWNQQSAALRNRFTSQMRIGLARGESVQDLTRRVRGDFSGKWTNVKLGDGSTQKVRQFTGGIMQTSTREAETLVRSSVATVSNEVLQETYEENDDVVKGWMAVATLDTRTTPYCRSIDKCCWDKKGKPLPESPRQIPDPGPPPYHYNCRTVRAPLTYSWEELIARAKGTMKKKVEEIPQGTRASMDGQVPESLTYENWLKQQSEARQLEVLGPGRLKLWKDGKINFSQMVDQSGNPVSLDELQKQAGN